MKKILFTLCVLVALLAQPVWAQVQVFNQASDMTLPTLNRYLAHSITMQGLMDVQKNANSSAAAQATYNQQLAMLANLNARFIGRAAGRWDEEYKLDADMLATQQMVADIHAAYRLKGITEMPIVQGSIFEIITGNIDQITVPGEIVAKFYPGQTASRKFNHLLTSYDSLWIRMNRPNGGVLGANPACPDDYPYNCPERYSWGGATWAVVPDMSKPETQMWFYFVATKLIDAGCEAIHFGQVEMMDRIDINHASWWKVLSMIRQYAASKNRGIVLCDAHTTGVYYDDPANPVPAAQRQLIFDFHSYPLRPQEDGSKPWNPRGGGAYIDNLGGGCGSYIYNVVKEGKPYLNWGTVDSLPYMVEFDNWGIKDNGGELSNYCAPWKWDEISWFGIQTNNYRNQWLKYAYYKVQCMDRRAHLEMPGLRGMTWSTSKPIYQASNGPVSAGNFNQETMIRDLWNGIYDKEWSYTDIMDNYTPGYVPDVLSNPVWVGSNLYYIGTDNYIRAFIKNGAYWDPISPTEIAGNNGQSIASQVKAVGELVATPDGQLLVYRGVDGELYAFDILGNQNYYYHKLASSQLQAPEKVKSDLICMDNNHFYYRSANDQIYAYVRCCGNQWTPTSPSWTANQWISVNNQAKSMGGLVVNPSHNRLYYTGQDGRLHGFIIDNSWSYRYFDLPQLGMELGNGQLVCASDDRLFFVDQLNSRVFGAQLNPASGAQPAQPSYGGTWGRISPSYEAQLEPAIGLSEQVKVKSDLTISPDGSLLAYIGVDNMLHGYRTTDATTTEYLDFAPIKDSFILPSKGLQLNSSTQLAYISIPKRYDCFGNPMGKLLPVDPDNPNPPCPWYTAAKMVIGELVTQPITCDKPIINFIQQPYSNPQARFTTTAVVTSPKVATTSTFEKFSFYPNPANAEVQIVLPASTLQINKAKVRLQDVFGQVVREVELSFNKSDNSLLATLSVQDLSTGMYLIVITDNIGKCYSEKLSIQH
jgi:hypothetical protein